MIELRRSTAADRENWNTFLFRSRTSCFLFSRDFMEYHQDRFTDYSLLVLEDDKLVAIFPANIRDNELHSHGGLTFGGLIVTREARTGDTLNYLAALLQYLHGQNIQRVFYKQAPSFYNSCADDEIAYAMFILEAKMFRMDITYAIDTRLQPAIPCQERRTRAIKKARQAGISIKESNSMERFWKEVLEPNLQQRYGVNPVHSLEEIESLRLANPGKIRQFEAWQENQLLAGTTIFENPGVVHAQYISATDEGRKSGALDLLFHQLISEVFSSKQFFDFGIVNESGGRFINKGLQEWKEGFGAKAFAHRFYEIDTAQYPLLEKISER